MKLSDAIATGRVIPIKTDPLSFCGCALAMGLLGAGKQPKEMYSVQWLDAAVAEWPWLNQRFLDPQQLYAGRYALAHMLISEMFMDVHHGDMTLDQLIDWVRQNEPPEAPEQTKDVLEQMREDHYDFSANTR